MNESRGSAEIWASQSNILAEPALLMHPRRASAFAVCNQASFSATKA